MKRLALFLLMAVMSVARMVADTVTTEGAWCWFADPRALHYETPDGRINMTYLGYIDIHGNVKAMQYDFNECKRTEVLIRSYFQPDDHNNPTFLALPDGRIMIFYSRHTDEPCFYYRVSRERGDITTLGEEKKIMTKNNTTYPSPFILADDPTHIYLCWRGINWHPTIAKLSLPDAKDDVKIEWGPYQMVQSTGARPYAKYASDGKGKILFTYTTGHPDNESPNYLYYNYVDIKKLTLNDINGQELSKIADGPFRVSKKAEYVDKYPATIVDASGYRDWVWQIVPGNGGRPAIAMTRISDNKKSHNYYYAQWTGKEWKKTFVAHGGGHFHQTPNIELCYSGGMALDAANPNIVYCSVPVDGANGRVYEIQRYQLDGNGEVTSMQQITRNSKKSNSRPYLIPGSTESAMKLAWMSGDYYDWIVSSARPKGYCTGIESDFAGFDVATYGAARKSEVEKKNEAFDFNPTQDFSYSTTVKLDTAKYGCELLKLGKLSYLLDAKTMKPVVSYKGKKYVSTNILATADNWSLNPRGTNGDWYTPLKYSEIRLCLKYENGVLQTYINGMLDQSVRLNTPYHKKPVFEVVNPDFKLSPFTGLTREHWIQAAEYLLDGAFSHIHSLDDQMYFPKQLNKTYPRDNGAVTVAKLEGLCRTLFIAAPLLRENPDLTLNGIKVADYFRHQIINMTHEGSTSYIAHRTGGPSQTLLELGAMCISLKIAQPVLWDTLTKAQRDELASLLLSYGEGPTIDSNWRFFNVFVLSFLKDQGYTVKDDYLEMNLNKLLERYRGEGWYNDAPAYDYYSMWAFQTYGPLWAEYFGKKQFPKQAEQFLKNQHDLVDNYPYMYSRDGKMNMWGRSLPYRFASVSPLALLEYNESNADVNYGWMRRISSATLLQFMQHPDFMEDGVPTMGYFGVFAPCVQIYSCRGSVYWLGKAFFNLLLPEDSKYWSAKENNGPWENELKVGNVYNKFQPATNLMITNYPDCGGSEMRSWCNEKVANDWQKFRSSENYNKLAYHTEFPWMADGKNGEISMNFGTKNKYGDWEVLRLYTFKSFENGMYRRDAVLETDERVKYQLTDIPLPGGVLRVDKVTVPSPTDIRLGSYSLPRLDKGFSSSTINLANAAKAYTLGNQQYQLAVVPLAGWQETAPIYPYGLHPMSDQCGVLVSSDHVDNTEVYVTLHLWKRGNKAFTAKELMPVKSVTVSADKKSVTINFSDGTTKTVAFE